jgi:hypothetical protein
VQKAGVFSAEIFFLFFSANETIAEMIFYAINSVDYVISGDSILCGG